jgi:hypothetical protein
VPAVRFGDLVEGHRGHHRRVPKGLFAPSSQAHNASDVTDEDVRDLTVGGYTIYRERPYRGNAGQSSVVSTRPVLSTSSAA